MKHYVVDRTDAFEFLARLLVKKVKEICILQYEDYPRTTISMLAYSDVLNDVVEIELPILSKDLAKTAKKTIIEKLAKQGYKNHCA